MADGLALTDGEYDEVTDTDDDGVAVALLVWVEDGVDVGDVDDDPESVALSDFSAAEVKTLRAMLLRLYQNASPLA